MGSKDGGGPPGKSKPPQMSTQVLLHSLGLGYFAPIFEKAGFTMIEGHSKWSDQDVDEILQAVSDRSGEIINPDDRVLLWKALRYMWHRGPGHDAPFIEPSEVPPLFLPKRDARQMDSELKFAMIEPDRQRQIVRKMTLISGRAGLTQVQFEVYRRQTDIFYELKDIQRTVAEWQKMNPRKMLREDPREEAMKVRIRRMLDAAADWLQDRHAEKTSLRWEGNFFFFCQLLLVGMAFVMFATAYKRYQMTPKIIFWEFFFSSKQFLSGVAYFLAFVVAYAVADHHRADDLERRYKRMIVSLERLVEEISAFRVETDEFRMEEQEAIRQQISAAIEAAQVKAKKQEQPRKRRRKKKHVDEDIANWAPNVKADNQAEFQLKIVKGIEESYKRLPQLGEGFRRQGGDRMHQFQGVLGGIEDDSRKFKSEDALHVHRTEPHLAVGWAQKHGHLPADAHHSLPSLPGLPMPSRAPMPPPLGLPGPTAPAGTTPTGQELRDAADAGSGFFSGFMDTSALTASDQQTPMAGGEATPLVGDRTLTPPATAAPPFSLSDSISLEGSSHTPLRRASQGTWPSGEPVGGLPPARAPVMGSTPRDGTAETADASAERSQLRAAGTEPESFGSPPGEGVTAETTPLRSAAGAGSHPEAASLSPPPSAPLPGSLPGELREHKDSDSPPDSESGH